MRKMMVAVSAAVVLGLCTLAVAEEKEVVKAPDGPITIVGQKPALFDHSVHLGLEGISCGSCHHDANHKPLGEEDIAKIGSAKKLACVSCHNSEFPNKELSSRKTIFHTNCKECHKKGVGDTFGPTKCTDCHVKNEK